MTEKRPTACATTPARGRAAGMTREQMVDRLTLDHLIAYVRDPSPYPLPEDVRIAILNVLQRQWEEEHRRVGRPSTRAVQARLMHLLLQDRRSSQMEAAHTVLRATNDTESLKVARSLIEVYRTMKRDGSFEPESDRFIALPPYLTARKLRERASPK